MTGWLIVAANLLVAGVVYGTMRRAAPHRSWSAAGCLTVALMVPVGLVSLWVLAVFEMPFGIPR